uniref:Uncharacterized protein n=1 Tax=Gadus morhua TaxID=8049 RepID=A0A8C5BTS2_GADMO
MQLLSHLDQRKKTSEMEEGKEQPQLNSVKIKMEVHTPTVILAACCSFPHFCLRAHGLLNSCQSRAPPSETCWGQRTLITGGGRRRRVL